MASLTDNPSRDYEINEAEQQARDDLATMNEKTTYEWAMCALKDKNKTWGTPHQVGGFNFHPDEFLSTEDILITTEFYALMKSQAAERLHCAIASYISEKHTKEVFK